MHYYNIPVQCYYIIVAVVTLAMNNVITIRYVLYIYLFVMDTRTQRNTTHCNSHNKLQHNLTLKL